MENSDSQLSRSAEICHVRDVSENEGDENSMNKVNVQLRSSSFKLDSTGDSRSLAVDLLRRIETLEQKLDLLESREP